MPPPSGVRSSLHPGVARQTGNPEDRSRLAPYVPRLVSDWDRDAPGALWQPVTGSLVLVDISGFTSLSERLASKGRVGAEELTLVLNRVFGRMLDAAFERGGSLLKFGGDALLLLFRSDDHVRQAIAATVEMRSVLREAAEEPTSVGRIGLRMSSGIHTGTIDFFLVGTSHRELLITGPAATAVAEMETIARAGEIVVSEAVRQRIPGDFLGQQRDTGWLVRKRRIEHPTVGAVSTEALDPGDYTGFVPRSLRPHLATGKVDSEHRIATVAFVKFTGVDASIREEGPEALAERLNQLVADVQRRADAEGVTFLATDIDKDGGKVILTSGVPVSQHDDEGRVLRTVRSIVDAQQALPVRAGVNRGHVFSGDVGTEWRRTFTVMGDTVNLAARLMAAAPVRSVFASPAALDLSSTIFRTETLEPLAVKGIAQPVSAYAVFEETGARPPDMAYELPFHGRDAELRMVVEIVTTCARVGQGGVMTISGDTGIGKTRLIAEVLQRCPGLDTLTLQAEPYAADNPYWAFRDPMRRALGIARADHSEMSRALAKAVPRIAPDLSWALPLIGDVLQILVPDNDVTTAIDAQFRPERTADVIIELLGHLHAGPFAVIVEDGQWLDDASLAMLERVGVAAESRPWTVIVTARAETGRFGSVGSSVRLRPLADDTVRQIVIEATAGAPLRPHELDAVVARSGGNPLFVAEILGALRDTGNIDQLPETLDAVVSTQIDTLAPLTRQILRYSAVLGSSFRRAVLDEILEAEGIELDDATDRGLRRFLEADGPERLRFRHTVVHDVAYQGLSFRRRRELHARAGAVVEAAAGTDADDVAEVLATHFSLAGDYAKVWRYAPVAAERARRAYANTEAAAQYRRAIEAAGHVDQASPEHLARMWAELGEVQELAGQFEAARESYSNALRLETEDPLQIVDLYLLRARAWMNSGNTTQAKRNVTLGRNHLTDRHGAVRDRAVARLDAFEAQVHARKGDPIRAYECATAAVESAGQAGEEEALARAYRALDWANFMLGRDEERHGEEAIEILQRLGFLERSVGVINNMGAFAYLEGNWDEATDWYRKSVDAAERSGNVSEAALTRANIAEVLIGQRRYREALDLLANARRVFDASRATAIMPFVDLQTARANCGTGDLERAIQDLEGLVESQMSGSETAWTADTVVALASALVAEGRGDEAEERLNRLESKLPDGAARVKAGIMRVRAGILAALGDLSGAEEMRRAGLETAVADGDLYEETLILESLVDADRQGGSDPDPAASERLDELRVLLGIKAEQPV